MSRYCENPCGRDCLISQIWDTYEREAAIDDISALLSNLYLRELRSLQGPKTDGHSPGIKQWINMSSDAVAEERSIDYDSVGGSVLRIITGNCSSHPISDGRIVN